MAAGRLERGYPGHGVLRTVVVDDSRALRALTRAHLEVHGGFAVVGEGHDGRSGIAAVRRHAPDLVLLDLAMPGMSGLEALPEIRRLAPRTRVLIHSSLCGDVVERQVLEAGADALLPKGPAMVGLPDRVLDALARLDAAAPSGWPIKAGVRPFRT